MKWPEWSHLPLREFLRSQNNMNINKLCVETGNYNGKCKMGHTIQYMYFIFYKHMTTATMETIVIWVRQIKKNTRKFKFVNMI